MKELKIGDTCYFGKYPQRDSARHTEPVLWRVMDRKADKLLLLSDRVLDSRPFDGEHDPFYWNATWEKCTLRHWLNREFYDFFSEEEKNRILETELKADPNPSYGSDSGNDTVDKIFCFSLMEIARYFEKRTQAMARPTEYARSKGLLISFDPPGYCSYWLRTMGYNGRFASVIPPGEKKGRDISGKGSPYNSRYEGVRPGMWICV